ncbi:MAG TPA: diacylglyceryl transferase [Crocinitomicaceae bacterium]|nr:diacylglyceryl transferase [Crocinitomicaceae bacterium]
MKKLKERWGVKSNWDIAIILIVFSINGSISGYLMKPALKFLGITTDNLAWYFYWPLAFILILPVYFAMIIVVGTIFGQRKFFTWFVKKSLRRMKLIRQEDERQKTKDKPLI